MPARLRRLAPLATLGAALALAACGEEGPKNWSGSANVDYSAARSVYRAPVVVSNVRRVGDQMADYNKRANFYDPRNIKGLRSRGLLATTATPAPAQFRGPSVRIPHGVLRMPAPAPTAGRSLPNIGRPIR